MSQIIKPLSPEWFAARRTRITSTDAAAICGLPVSSGRYRDSTPLKIARRIKIARGLMEGELAPDLEENKVLRWGRLTEPVHAAIYEEDVSEETGAKRTLDRNCGLIFHPQFDWLASTPDGVIHCDGREPGIWEAKAPVFAWGRWSDGIPDAYLLQTAISLSITGLRWGSVSALKQPTCEWGDFEWSDKAWERIIGRLREWYERFVLQDHMPDAEAGDLGMLREIHRPEPRKTVYLPLELSDTAHELAALQAQAKAIDEQIDASKARIQQYLEVAKAEVALSADGEIGWQFTRKMQQVHPKPAVEAGEKEVVKFTRYTPKEDR